MKVALVGFPQSGKSTVFSAITGKSPRPAGYADMDEAVVAVPDERLDWLTGLYNPKKTVRANIDCLDLPGIDFTDARAKKDALKYLDELKSCDLYVLVIGAFKSPMVPPRKGSVDAVRDLKDLMAEFLLSDLQLVATRIERLERQVTMATKTAAQDKAELAVFQKIQPVLEDEKPAYLAGLDEKEVDQIKSLGLMTLRPMMALVNVDEGEIKQPPDFSGLIDASIPVLTMSAKIEQELAGLDGESRDMFMQELGITESAADRFIRACYSTLGLISFLTVGPDEVRAWPIRKGTSALDAAGKIHTDIKRGFIRAMTISYSDIKTLGDEAAVKAAGKLRQEGKEYVVQDGDIINFRFNV